MKAVHADYTSAPISARLRSALRALEVLSLRPAHFGDLEVDAMRDEGLDESDIEDVIGVGSLFAIFVRVADAFGFADPSRFENKLMKRALKTGYEKRDLLAEGFPRHEAGLQAVVDASMREGVSRMALRLALADWVDAQVRGTKPDPSELPEPLRDLVDKEVRHAFLVTDEDLEAVAAAGYKGEAIFEIVIAVAVAAGATRYRMGLVALFG